MMIQRVTIKEKEDDGEIRVLKSGVDPRSAQNVIGLDYHPEEEATGFIIPVGEDPNDFLLIAVDDGVEKITGPGEFRIYSVQSGEVKSSVYCKSDGNLMLNGGEDFAVQFTALKTAFDDLQSKYNSIVNVLKNWVVVANDGGAALKTAVNAIIPSPESNESIDAAKVESVRLP